MIPLNENENLILTLRRHSVWLVIKLISFAILLIGPAFIFGFLEYFKEPLSRLFIMINVSMLEEVYLFVLSVFYVFVWLYFFVDFLNYWLDVWIVTDRRVVIINQQGLFRRNISEIPISKIQDISFSIHGFLETTLNYGTVSIRTASEQASFKLEEIAHPEKIKQDLLNLMHKAQNTSLPV
jgi:membrane protein YdbS with pleckstrin-like domain